LTGKQRDGTSTVVEFDEEEVWDEVGGGVVDWEEEGVVVSAVGGIIR
jgi:hypothetical protein